MNSEFTNPGQNPDSDRSLPDSSIQGAKPDQPDLEEQEEQEEAVESFVDRKYEQEGASGDDWKTALRADFETWLESLDESDSQEEFAVDDTGMDVGIEEFEVPDLYQFFEQLTVLNAEYRKSNRRVAETLSQWNDVLRQTSSATTDVRRTVLALVNKISESSPPSNGMSRSMCLGLVGFTDRLLRILNASSNPPTPTWWGQDRALRSLFQKQQEALQIFLEHWETYLKNIGVLRMQVVGRTFDPSLMMAVGAEERSDRPHQEVVAEIEPGYLWNGEPLRVAQVVVARSPQRDYAGGGSNDS